MPTVQRGSRSKSRRKPAADSKRSQKELLEGFTRGNLKVVCQISDYKPERVN